MPLPPRHVRVTCKDGQTAKILFIIIRVNTRVYALGNVVDDNLSYRTVHEIISLYMSVCCARVYSAVVPKRFLLIVISY